MQRAVAPGTGWPGDLADPTTPVAHDARAVADLARVSTVDELDARVSVCRACPRLVSWREEVAVTRRAAKAIGHGHRCHVLRSTVLL